VPDGKPVTVWYKDEFSSQWQTIVSRVHIGTYRRNMPEYPHDVTFVIDGHDRKGRFVRSSGSVYRTWGSWSAPAVRSPDRDPASARKPQPLIAIAAPTARRSRRLGPLLPKLSRAAKWARERLDLR